MGKSIPTMVVKNKQGHLMRINATDYDPKKHVPAGEAAAEASKPKAKEPTKEEADDFQKKVTTAMSHKALEAIADEIGVEIPEDLKTLADVRAFLLSKGE
jgi:hypothetical protein